MALSLWYRFSPIIQKTRHIRVAASCAEYLFHSYLMVANRSCIPYTFSRPSIYRRQGGTRRCLSSLQLDQRCWYRRLLGSFFHVISNHRDNKKVSPSGSCREDVVVVVDAVVGCDSGADCKLLVRICGLWLWLLRFRRIDKSEQFDFSSNSWLKLMIASLLFTLVLPWFGRIP